MGFRRIIKPSKMKSLLTLAMVALLAVVFVPAKGSAQILYGNITGNVMDASGAAVPDAEISIINLETGQTREGKTGTSGVYTLVAVPTGTYDVHVVVPGFREFVKTGVSVINNGISRVNAMLEVGAVTESVTVTAETTELQTDKTDIRLELPNVEITNLPFGLNRNYQSLFKTLPGFSPLTRAHSIQTNPSRGLRFNVNGVTDSINTTKIDGASATNPWLPHVTSYVPSLDAIENVNIVTNSFDAEQGLAGGAAISVQTKSGTNDIHGTAYWFHDDSGTRARPFLFDNDKDAAGNFITTKPRFVYNQPGASLGGPIKKDKVFFFTAFELTLNRRNGFKINEVPTAAMRTGDFSEFLDTDFVERGDTDEPVFVDTVGGANIQLVDEQLFDPTTGIGDSGGEDRLAFENNIIPRDRWDPIVRDIIFPMIPLPNFGADSDGNFPLRRNYIGRGLFTWDRWTWDNKFDFVVSDKLNMFVSLSILNYDVVQPTIWGFDGLVGDELSSFGGGGGNAGTGTGTTYKFTVGANYIFSPTFIMDANYGYLRFVTDSRNPRFGDNIGLDLLGLPGTNGPDPASEDPGDYPYWTGWPRMDMSGYEDYGNEQSFMPYLREDPVSQYSANFTWIKNAHEIKFGFDFNNQWMNHIQPEGGVGHGSRGRFVFSRNVVRGRILDTDLDADPGDRFTTSMDSRVGSMAAFVLGLPNRMGKNTLGLAPYRTNTWSYGLYVRDRWQVTPKLTFNIGTRWEYYPIPTRGDGRGLERFDLVTGLIEVGGVGSVPVDLGVEMSKTLFSPRVGVAYRATDNLVFRAGYGITYDPYPIARALRTNFPMFLEQDLRADNSRDPAGSLSGISALTPLTFGGGVLDLSAGMPDIQTPASDPDNAGLVTIPSAFTAQTIPEKFDRGYIQSWNFMVETRLPAGFTAEAGYVASRSIRMLGDTDLNWGDIGAGNDGRQLVTAFGRTARTDIVKPIGHSYYNALQTRLKRRFADGMSFNVAYTWSKVVSSIGTDDDGDTGSDESLPIKIPRFYHLNQSLAAFNRPHNLQITNIIELPFGKGKRFLNAGGIASAIVGGWQVNNIFSVYSGTPVSVVSDSDLEAPGNRQRADRIKSGKVPILGGILEAPYFDTSFFAEPCTVDTTGCDPEFTRFGTAGFGILQNPRVNHWDFSLFREIPITETLDLQFRAEVFNMTNTPHYRFNNDRTEVTDDEFGIIDDDDGSAGQERVIRFGIRLSW